MELEDLAQLIDQKLEATRRVCGERSGNIRDEQAEMKEMLARIEGKIDSVNGRSKHNAWNIRAIWGIFGAAWAVLLIWLRGQIDG